MPHWTDKYIEIPFVPHGRSFDGVDCWGLFRLLFKVELNILLPSYTEDYENTNDAKSLGALIRLHLSEWHQVPFGIAQEFDGVLLRLKNEPMHVGVALGRKAMLHIHEGINVCVERFSSPIWRNRILGFYRHEQFIASGCT